jgi:hypothetical protein
MRDQVTWYGAQNILPQQNSCATDGGKVVNPTHQPHFTPQKHYYFNVSGTHFC